jgi:hypothetical protein
MNRKLHGLLTVLILASVHFAEAQQPAKAHRIGTKRDDNIQCGTGRYAREKQTCDGTSESVGFIDNPFSRDLSKASGGMAANIFSLKTNL